MLTVKNPCQEETHPSDREQVYPFGKPLTHPPYKTKVV